MAKPKSCLSLLITAGLLVLSGCGGSGTNSLVQTGPVAFTSGMVYVGNRNISSGNHGEILGLPNLSSATWRSYGPSTPADAVRPFAMTFDNEGRLIITDSDGQAAGIARLVRIDDMTGLNRVEYGTNGTGTGQFQTPEGLAVDSSDRIYVADLQNQRVIRVDDMTGTNWTELDSGGSHAFGQPRSVAFDSTGKLYVLSIGGTVFRFDNISGANPVSFSTGTSNPVGLAIDSTDRIYVTDITNKKVFRFDNMTGANPVSYGPSGTFDSANGIAIDSTGRIYIADEFSVKRMDDMVGTNLVSFGVPGHGVGKFFDAFGIAVR